MLSLCGEAFDYVHVALRAGEHKKPEYLEKNRYGQVPCLTDGPANLCQSASILQYLADILGKFNGNTPLERARIQEWMFWEFDRLAPAIYRSRAYRLGFRQADDAVKAMYAGEGETALRVLDAELGKSEWLTGGGPTIADIDVYGVVHYAADGGFDLSVYPNILAWKARLEALPGFARPEQLLPQPAEAA
ncbi:MAG: glutathione S-transferase family protein [Rhodomicrobium sp.]|nr:glutathione S-transferase family protein [Rhodomicrobium sp.]